MASAQHYATKQRMSSTEMSHSHVSISIKQDLATDHLNSATDTEFDVFFYCLLFLNNEPGKSPRDYTVC